MCRLVGHHTSPDIVVRCEVLAAPASSATLLAVAAERRAVEQMVLNLVFRAIDRVHDGGRVVLEVARLEVSAGPGRERGDAPVGFARLRVSDSGPAFTPAEGRQWFRRRTPGPAPGERAPHSRGPLDVAHALAIRAGGFVTVDFSSHARGATATLCLPLAAEPGVAGLAS